MTDTEKNAPEATAEVTETTNDQNDGTEGDVQKDNEHQRTINVGNLPKDVTEQQLRDHFTGHEVERVEIHHYLRNTLALLVFKEKAAAQKACEEKDGSMLNGRRLRMHIEYITIRYTKKDVIVVVVDDDMTEEKLYDSVKEHCEVTQVFIFHPLGYVHLGKDVDKVEVLDKLNAAGLKAYDVNGRDQNQHVDLWRAAKLFFRNRNRVQLLNIPQKWVENTDELKKACSEAGTITEAISNNVSQGSSNYYARIFFETEEQAAKAAELLNGKVFEGKRIHALHLSSALLPNYKTSVYVSPLERTVTEEDVYEQFKQYGEIDFVNRRNCGESAIVCYKTSEAAEKALACTTFPAPTEANKEATKTVAVKRYDGPLVLRAAGVKRKATAQRTTTDGKTRKPRAPDGPDRDKSHKDILQKLQAFYPVYVSNIPFGCPGRVIREFFSSLGGEVKFIFSPQHYLPYRLSSPQPVKTAMVYYTRRNDMMNAIKQLDKKMLNNQHLHVLPGRGDTNFNQQKTVKLTKINESLSEDAIFRKMRPLGKVVRLTKKNRSLAFVEFADSADVEKVLKMKQEELPINCTFSKITKDVSRRLYSESDPRILGTVVRLLRRNPRMLNKTTGAGPLMSGNNVVGTPGGFGGGKRPRMNGPPGFGNVPPFNPNNGGNNLNNSQAIQDLLRLAFMSGKNVGESLAAGGGNVGGNQGPNRGGGGGGSFNNADPPISNQGSGNNAFGGGDGGFGTGGGRNMNNRNQNMNFRGGNRNNQNNNVGGNRGLGNSNNNAGNNNFGNQNQNNSGGPRGGNVGALGGGGGVGGGGNNSGGNMMNNRNNMNNMGNRNNSNNMNMNNKRTGGNNLPQQNSALPVGGAVAGGVGNLNKGSGGMRGNNQGMGGGVSGMGGSGGGGMGGGGGGNNNRNTRNSNFNDNSSFGGSGTSGSNSNNNTFGGSSNNFASDNFGGGRNNDSYSNDNFGGGRNDNYASDNNFGGNSGGGGGGRNNFGNRNSDNFGGGRNDNFGGGSSNFGGNAFGGNNSRFGNDNDGPFSGNSSGNVSGGNNNFGLNNRGGNNSSNSRFSDDNIGGGGGGGYGGGNTNNRGNNFNDNSNNFGGNNRGSGGGNQKPQGLFNLGGGGSGGGNLGGGSNMSFNNFGGGNSNNSGGNNFRNNDNSKGSWMGGNNSNNSGLDTFDDERYYQSITPTPALPVPATIQAVAPATAVTTVITSDNSFQSEYIPVPRGDERYEFATSMMPRDTRMYEPTGLVPSAGPIGGVVGGAGPGDSSSGGGSSLSNAGPPPPVVPLSYRGDERHYYPVVSTISSSYLLDNRQYEQSLNSPSMMHDRLYQPTTHTITSGMLYNERSHYETATIAGPPPPPHLSSIANNSDCHAVDIMMRTDASVAAAAAAAAAGIEHAEASWRAEMMERQDEIDRHYLVLLPREDKIEPQDDL
uniref:RRM domain-containing protein n=1 Tax=Anopheles stephensi TaxID=30069 RepID=A0A182Y6Q0_ANOST